jgi:hypothetical protein
MGSLALTPDKAKRAKFASEDDGTSAIAAASAALPTT